MIHQGVRNVLQYNQQHPDFPMEVSKYVICTFSGNSDNSLYLLYIYFFISYVHHLKI